MKKLFIVISLVLFSSMIYAQEWLNGAGNIYTNPVYVAGFVGIHTTTPTADLDIFESGRKADFVCRTTWTPPAPAGTATTTLAQFDLQCNGANDFFRNVVRKNSANQFEMLQTIKSTAAGGTLAFMYVNFATRKYEMRAGIMDVDFQNAGQFNINSAGAVAIGMGTTAVPAGAKLCINGKVVAKEIEVTLTGLPPDYVFDKSYKLRSLYDVENFINTNKHLPGVPSATEMTKGVNVGDMNSTLLQKVEELTLYMIQLQKENDALKVRISNLEK